MNKKTIQKITQREKRELVSAHNKGTLYETIAGRAMEIKRADNGNITKIVFSVGGPNIFLQFNENDTGFIVVALDQYISKSKIPSTCLASILEEFSI